MVAAACDKVVVHTSHLTTAEAGHFVNESAEQQGDETAACCNNRDCASVTRRQSGHCLKLN